MAVQGMCQGESDALIAIWSEERAILREEHVVGDDGALRKS